MSDSSYYTYIYRLDCRFSCFNGFSLVIFGALYSLLFGVSQGFMLKAIPWPIMVFFYILLFGWRVVSLALIPHVLYLHVQIYIYDICKCVTKFQWSVCCSPCETVSILCVTFITVCMLFSLWDSVTSVCDFNYHVYVLLVRQCHFCVWLSLPCVCWSPCEMVSLLCVTFITMCMLFSLWDSVTSVCDFHYHLALIYN